MPDFENDQLRDEERHGGFMDADADAFGAQGAATQDAQEALEDIQNDVGGDLAHTAHEALHSPDARQSFGGESNREPHQSVNESRQTLPTNKDTSGSQGSHHLQNSLGSPQEPHKQQVPPLRFGFDEPKPSNQRVPPPVQKSWLARNGAALAVTSALTLVSGGVAAFLLTAQNDNAQMALKRLFGQETNTTQMPQPAQNAAQPLFTSEADSAKSSGQSLDLTKPNNAALDKNAFAQDDVKLLAAQPRPPESAQAKPAQMAATDAKSVESKLSESPVSSPTASSSTANPTTSNPVTSKPATPKSVKPLPAQTSSKQETPQSQKASSKASSDDAAKAVATKPAVAGLYAVQVYSTSSPFDAERVKRQLQVRGLPTVRVSSVDLGTRFMYRVRFGSYQTQRDAERAADRSGYAETWIAKIR